MLLRCATRALSSLVTAAQAAPPAGACGAPARSLCAAAASATAAQGGASSTPAGAAAAGAGSSGGPSTHAANGDSAREGGQGEGYARQRRGNGDQSTIDFGFARVPRQEKESMVRGVFDSVAGSYDVMNDLMSAGAHRLWKDYLVHSVLRPHAGSRHLDVAGGTGDVARRVLDAARVQEAAQGNEGSRTASVTVCDINTEMLAAGQARAAREGWGAGLEWVAGNAERLPFEDESYDSYTIAFGIRNVTDRDAALREAHRILRPGGRFLCLEFSHVDSAPLAAVYDAYSFHAIPAIGALVAGDAPSYRYLVESIREFPSRRDFAGMVRRAGFGRVTAEPIMGGVVAIHSGYKGLGS